MAKKFVLVFCAALLILASLGGCAASKPGEPAAKNTVFTDEFFEGVVSVDYTTLNGIEGEDLNNLIAMLKGLTLTPTDKSVWRWKGMPEELSAQLPTANGLVFYYADGSSRNCLFAGKTVSFSRDKNYALEEYLDPLIGEALGWREK